MRLRVNSDRVRRSTAVVVSVDGLLIRARKTGRPTADSVREDTRRLEPGEYVTEVQSTVRLRHISHQSAGQPADQLTVCEPCRSAKFHVQPQPSLPYLCRSAHRWRKRSSQSPFRSC